MFYEPKKKNHGLPKNPFNSLIIPRPIGWISSADESGIHNLAPYSFFNAVSYSPPTVMFSGGLGSASDRLKDSVRNIEETGEFVCNLATWDTREQMNKSSQTLPPESDEIVLSGLTAIPSEIINAPRIKEAPVHLECRYLKSVDIPGWNEKDAYRVIFGEVVGIHINDEFITEEGLVDVIKMLAIGRLGYGDYTRVDSESIFSMNRP